MADFFAAYAKILELNVWVKTRVLSSAWDDGQKKWVVVERCNEDGTRETRTVHPAHIVQATGHARPQHMPTIKGMETFTGTIFHSAGFSNTKPKG